MERADQRLARVAGGQLRVYTAEYVNGPSRLLDEVPALSTPAQMPFEMLDLDGCHRTFDVLGDELDDLLAQIRTAPKPEPAQDVGDVPSTHHVSQSIEAADRYENVRE